MERNTTLLAGAVAVLILLGAWGAYAYMHGTSAPITTVATSTQPAVPPQPTASTPLIHAYGTITLSLGQSAKFADVTITPTSIVQDSRCPVDVQCIQAGTVQASVRIGSATQTLTLNKPFSTSAATIILTSVQPAKRSTVSIAPGDYRLTFDVEKKAAAGKCYVGGCSAEICSDQPGAVSNCIYTAAYGCYRTATCERQVSGACGWTQTPALKACLANPPR